MVDDIRRPLRMVTPILLFAIAFGTSSASFAQATVSPSRAEAFVRVAMTINQVGEEWQPRIDRAKSEVEVERLRDQVNVAMREAIRDVGGMTVDDYWGGMPAVRRRGSHGRRYTRKRGDEIRVRRYYLSYGRQKGFALLPASARPLPHRIKRDAMGQAAGLWHARRFTTDGVRHAQRRWTEQAPHRL